MLCALGISASIHTLKQVQGDEPIEFFAIKQFFSLICDVAILRTNCS